MRTKEFEAFRMHKRTAAERGIRFYFSFDQWVGWWFKMKGANWLKKRGRHKGLYVMSRRNDKGPYASWNVDCVLFEDNCRARRLNGTAARGASIGISKIDDKTAQAIFLADGVSVADIGRQFGVSAGIVRQIKKRICWYHVTDGLTGPPIHTYNHLTKKDVKAIYLDPRPTSAVAKDYGRSEASILAIRKHRAWRKVTATLTPRRI